MMFYGGFPAVGMLLFWLLTIVILGGTVYLAVRFAVLHALKSHTRWIDAGKPSGPPAPPQTPGGPEGLPASIHRVWDFSACRTANRTAR
ncbi:hypothetical protein G3H63_03790, partial [Microbacterium resistens]|uniref:hypothetical protein n=1 Tax=Microbacterium resistens TaxID=156977 RepID=UPI001C585BDA